LIERNIFLRQFIGAVVATSNGERNSKFINVKEHDRHDVFNSENPNLERSSLLGNAQCSSKTEF